MIQRLIRLVGGYLGIIPEESRPTNAEMVLAAHTETFRSKIAHFNQSLAAAVAFCELLAKQIKTLEQEELAIGSSPQASDKLSMRRQSPQTELTDLREQLKRAEQTRTEILQARETAIRAARGHFAELKGLLDERQIQMAWKQVPGIPEATDESSR